MCRRRRWALPLGAARADTDENKNKNEMADKEATAGAGGELATTGNAAAAVAEPQPVAQADSKAIEATDAVGITKDATGDGAVDDDGSDDDDADGMEHDNAIVDDGDAGDEAEVDGTDDDDDADYDMDDDLDDTVDASKMKWPCQECGCGMTLTPAVPCEGRLCLLRPARNVYAEDARALCYPCAGVTHATVGEAPPFICVRCFDAA